MNDPTLPTLDLLESAARLRFALEAADLGQWDLDLRTGLTERTRRTNEIFGYDEPLPEWTVEVFLAHVVPEERETVDAAFRRVFEGPDVWEIQCHILRVDGQTRHIWFRGRIYRDASGVAERMLGIVGDDTERRRAEQALTQSDTRLRLLDSISEATRKAADPVDVMQITLRMLGEQLHVTRCAYADVDSGGGHFTIHADWNAAGMASAAGTYRLENFGSRAVGLVRRGAPIVFHDVDREMEPDDGADSFNAIGVKAVITFPLVRNGVLMTLMAVHNATPRVWTAEEISLVGAVAERSWAHIESVRAQAQLSEREAWLRHLIATVPGALWTATPEGEVDYTSPWLHLFTGLPAERFESRHWPEFMHPEDLPLLQQRWMESVNSGEPYKFQARLRRADGVYRWIDFLATAALDDQGRVLRWYAIALDVHEHVQTLDALERSEQALRDADRRKDEFLAMLAHELRNPLAPIRNGLHLLRMAPADVALRSRTLDMMERQFTQLVRLVDDLLDVSRVSRNVVELSRERIELGAVLDSAIEMNRPLIEAGGIDLHLALTTEPVVLDADAARLTQVFGNLLNNAIKFSRRDSRIWLQAASADGAVRVSVRDEGIGIAPSMLSQVFDLFVQADRSLERNRSGLGVGLTLARRLVEMHGGSIEARSEGADRGSEFIVRLPLAEAAGSLPVASAPQSMSAGALRIVLADDNRDAADGLAVILEMLGHEVRVAYDGVQALALAREFKPQVMLLDIGMPELNGLDTARRLRAEAWEGVALTLIALSGWGQQEDRRRSREAGFDHHLVKPLNLDLLRPLLAGAAQAVRPQGAG